MIILAVLKSGAAYIPLSPDYPDSYLTKVIEDCYASVLVTQQSLMARFAGVVPCIALDEVSIIVVGQSAEPIKKTGGGDDLAMVIYTSGSTGEPKGVRLAHTAAHFISWAREMYDPDELAEVAWTTSVAFDPSVLEIFLPLSVGGMVLIKQDALEPFVPGERPTMLTGVPSALAALAEANAIPDSVKVINSGGERLTPALVSRLFQQSRVGRVFDHYGPTEASICVAASVRERGSAEDGARLRALPNVQLYVLDPEQNPVRPGEIGEAYVGGSTLAIDYLNQPELTAARFLPDPFTRCGRMYRTGDLFRTASDGAVQFVGRRDDQVKLRGFRIELGEIESRLCALPSVRSAVAAVRSSPQGDHLAAWLETDADLTQASIRLMLGPVLPAHMIPTRVYCLPRLPLTPSGKIDRKALWSSPTQPPVGRALSPGQGSGEHEIVAAYRAVLSTDDVGSDDDFFEIGGTSLLALVLAKRIEAALDRPVDPSIIYSERTPRRLADAIVGRGRSGAGHVTALQLGGVERPLFCVSGIDGLPTGFLALAKRLAPDRAVYFLSPGPSGAAMIQKPSMSDLAAIYLETLRMTQDGGPYQVCGYSAGAAAALALACALEARGEDVLLVLVDPVVSWRLPPPGFIARWLVEQVAPSMRERGVVSALRSLQRLRHVLLRSQRFLTLANVPKGTPDSERRLARAMLQAEVDWRFESFGGPVLMVQSAPAGPAEAFINFDGLNGLADRLTGAVVKAQISTAHADLMREPSVAEVSKHVSSYLRRLAPARQRMPEAAE